MKGYIQQDLWERYVVTYKTVDPLFVIDLSNPTAPVVLGELKIPGYSSYLHPIGENYLLGFGEDTIERAYTNWNGEEIATAYANGLKMAIIFSLESYSVLNTEPILLDKETKQIPNFLSSYI